MSTTYSLPESRGHKSAIADDQRRGERLVKDLTPQEFPRGRVEPQQLVSHSVGNDYIAVDENRPAGGAETNISPP